jgi:hypothetical protein
LGGFVKPDTIMENETPRRNRLDLNTPAEKAIYDAVQEVEKVGADPKLTDVVLLLSKAKDLLSDYVDGKQTEQKQVSDYRIELEE